MVAYAVENRNVDCAWCAEDGKASTAEFRVPLIGSLTYPACDKHAGEFDQAEFVPEQAE